MTDFGHKRLNRRLVAVAKLTPGAAETLSSLPFSYAEFSSQSVIYAPGAELDQYMVLVAGSVCRYKVTPTGEQVICSFEFPGDILNADNLALDRSDCGARAVTHVQVATVSRPALDAARQSSRKLDNALQRYALVRAAAAEEWLVNVGRRPDRERVAHLICELVTRAAVADIPWQHVSPLLPSPENLAGATGLSVIHVTRALRDLTAEGAIDYVSGSINIRDIERLKELGRFRAEYLHLADA